MIKSPVFEPLLPFLVRVGLCKSNFISLNATSLSNSLQVNFKWICMLCAKFFTTCINILRVKNLQSLPHKFKVTHILKPYIT